jgi:uncharacterized protein YraI
MRQIALHRSSSFAGLLVALWLLLAAGPASAQGVNLLADPGFDGENYVLVSIAPDDQATFSVPVGWGGGVLRQPSTERWMNLQPTGFPHTGPFLWSGPRSLHLGRGFATFTAWVYQQVSVSPGSPLSAGANVYLENNVGSSARVGIDPNGGANPFDPAVIWSDWVGGLNTWNFPRVSAQADGGVATIFLFATQFPFGPSNPNGVYWDEAFLIGIPGDGTLPGGGGGNTGGGAAPAPQTVNPTANVYIRRGPGTSFPRIGGGNVGDALPFLGQEGDWYAVDFNGQRGYISTLYAELSGAGGGSSGGGGEAFVPAVDALTVTLSYALRFRAGPDEGAAELAIIPYPNTVRAIGRSASNAWLQVEFNGQVGWVAARFGRLDGDIRGLPVR